MKRSRWRSPGWWRWQLRRPGSAFKRLLKWCFETHRHYFPKRLTDDEFFAKLQKDVETVQKHITDAFRYRKMFRDTTAMLQEHPTLSQSPAAGYWYDWLRTLYAHYIVMAVRRELDRGSDDNMYRLLHNISKRPQVVSRARYKAFYDGMQMAHELGVNLWDRPFTEWAGPGDYIDPAMVRKDLDALDKQARLVIAYANRIVSHRTSASVPTTLRHVNDSLEAIEKILKKYYGLLTGGALMAAEPSILVPWHIAFRESWIPQR